MRNKEIQKRLQKAREDGKLYLLLFENFYYLDTVD